ncbi:hypothetical protein OsI_27050 [Oryza sativa Indica Group]|uniref:Uncharacterized protein n=1 Tax=Oryza sativa subsp. indica TaxID=39946 RepID=B8B533_ORYSI|nr:hypothetical protein OsI_27050 [Oryza sativa Indica Group]
MGGEEAGGGRGWDRGGGGRRRPGVERGAAASGGFGWAEASAGGTDGRGGGRRQAWIGQGQTGEGRRRQATVRGWAQGDGSGRRRLSLAVLSFQICVHHSATCLETGTTPDQRRAERIRELNDWELKEEHGIGLEQSTIKR